MNLKHLIMYILGFIHCFYGEAQTCDSVTFLIGQMSHDSLVIIRNDSVVYSSIIYNYNKKVINDSVEIENLLQCMESYGLEIKMPLREHDKYVFCYFIRNNTVKCINDSTYLFTYPKEKKYFLSYFYDIKLYKDSPYIYILFEREILYSDEYFCPSYIYRCDYETCTKLEFNHIVDLCDKK